MQRIPDLNTRHRLLAMALNGQISEQEFHSLENTPQNEFKAFEARDHNPAPDWTEGLWEQLQAIELEALDIFIAGYRGLSMEEREHTFAPRLRSRLIRLARSGRVTEEEFDRLHTMLDPMRYR